MRTTATARFLAASFLLYVLSWRAANAAPTPDSVSSPTLDVQSSARVPQGIQDTTDTTEREWVDVLESMPPDITDGVQDEVTRPFRRTSYRLDKPGIIVRSPGVRTFALPWHIIEAHSRKFASARKSTTVATQLAQTTLAQIGPPLLVLATVPNNNYKNRMVAVMNLRIVVFRLALLISAYAMIKTSRNFLRPFMLLIVWQLVQHALYFASTLQRAAPHRLMTYLLGAGGLNALYDEYALDAVVDLLLSEMHIDDFITTLPRYNAALCLESTRGTFQMGSFAEDCPSGDGDMIQAVGMERGFEKYLTHHINPNHVDRFLLALFFLYYALAEVKPHLFPVVLTLAAGFIMNRSDHLSDPLPRIGRI